MANGNRRGPLGNAPRDLGDSYVGEPAEDIKAPAPMRWPPNPKKVTKNTFHAKVSGKNATARADRAPGYYRRGGWVKARARGGDVKEEKPDTGMPLQGGADIGKESKRQFGGRVSTHTQRHVLHGDPLRSRTVTTQSTHRDRLAGEYKGGGATKKRQAGGSINQEAERERRRDEDVKRPLAERRFLEGKNYQDGGGISSRRVKPTGPRNPPPIGETQGLKSGGRLTAAKRQSLPRSDFALPGKGEGPKGAGAGSYPIPDESHARNALARVSQHGSSAQKAAVRRKVEAKFPGIKQSS